MNNAEENHTNLTELRETPGKLANLRAEFEATELSYSAFSDKFGVKKPTLQYWIKTYGWTRGKTIQTINDKVNAIQTLNECEKKIDQETDEGRRAINRIVDNRLKVEGMYLKLETSLLDKTQEQLNAFVPTKEDAVDNVVKLSSSLKNIRPPSPNTVVNNSVQSNTLNISSEEKREEIGQLLEGY